MLCVISQAKGQSAKVSLCRGQSFFAFYGRVRFSATAVFYFKEI